MSLEQVKDFLNSHHINVQSSWLHQAVELCKTYGYTSSMKELCSSVLDMFLNSNLSESYVAPMKIPSVAVKIFLTKPIIFQVVSYMDISRPVYEQFKELNYEHDDLSWFHGEHNENDNIFEVESTSKFKKRMLKLQLSDGTNQLFGIEHGVLSNIPDNLKIGAKIILSSRVLCRRGVMLLKDTNCQFLGGEINQTITNVEKAKKFAAILGIQYENGKIAPNHKLPDLLPPVKASSKAKDKKVSDTSMHSVNGNHTLSPFLVRKPRSNLNNTTSTSTSRENFQDDPPLRLQEYPYSNRVQLPKISNDVNRTTELSTYSALVSSLGSPNSTKLANITTNSNLSNIRNDRTESDDSIHPALYSNIRKLTMSPEVQCFDEVPKQSVPKPTLPTANKNNQANVEHKPLNIISSNSYDERMHEAMFTSISGTSKDSTKLNISVVPPRVCQQNLETERHYNSSTVTKSAGNKITPTAQVCPRLSSNFDRSNIKGENLFLPLINPRVIMHNPESKNTPLMPDRDINNNVSELPKQYRDALPTNSRSSKQNANKFQQKKNDLNNNCNTIDDNSFKIAHNPELQYKNSLADKMSASNSIIPGPVEPKSVRNISNLEKNNEISDCLSHHIQTDAMKSFNLPPINPQLKMRFSTMNDLKEIKSSPSEKIPAVISDIHKKPSLSESGVRSSLLSDDISLQILDRSDPALTKNILRRHDQPVVQNLSDIPEKRIRTDSSVDHNLANSKMFSVDDADKTMIIQDKIAPSSLSVMERFKQLNIGNLRSILDHKSYWMLPKIVLIQGICKVPNDLKARNGVWVLHIMVTDESMSNLYCEVDSILLDRMLGFTVQSCQASIVTRNVAEMQRRKERAVSVLHSLKRLDLLFSIEMYPENDKVPLIRDIKTLPEALEIVI